MGKGLNYQTFRERLRINRIIRPVRDKYGEIAYGDIAANRAALAECISLLEEAVQGKPDEWVCWYILGDLYQPAGEFAKSVQAGEKCYELRPKDPRSAYALASNLRTLTHAKYVGNRPYVEARLRLQVGMGGPACPFDPDRSLRALEQLGITLDQAAERTLTLFEEVLSLGVPENEAIHVGDTLAAIYSEFPHLEQGVKSTRVAPKGLLAKPRW